MRFLKSKKGVEKKRLGNTDIDGRSASRSGVRGGDYEIFLGGEVTNFYIFFFYFFR